MSRTYKHIAARAYHKRLREAIFGHSWNGGTGAQDLEQVLAISNAATPQESGTTRYGSPLRHYYADFKLKQRRIDRCKAKEAMRAELNHDE